MKHYLGILYKYDVERLPSDLGHVAPSTDWREGCTAQGGDRIEERKKERMDSARDGGSGSPPGGEGERRRTADVSLSEKTRFLKRTAQFGDAKKRIEETAAAVLPKTFMNDERYESFEHTDRMHQERLPPAVHLPSLSAAAEEEEEAPSTAGATLEEVMKAAEAVSSAFQNIVTAIVDEVGLKPNAIAFHDGNPIVLDPSQPSSTGYFRRLTLVPLKSRKRCREKMESDYDCDASRLVDVVRCSIVVDDESQLVAVSDALLRGSVGEHPKFQVVRLKNRFKRPLFNGYCDALFNIAVPVGVVAGGAAAWHVCEVQVHLAALARHKEQSYAPYEYFRAHAPRMRALQPLIEFMEKLDEFNGVKGLVERMAGAVLPRAFMTDEKYRSFEQTNRMRQERLLPSLTSSPSSLSVGEVSASTARTLEEVIEAASAVLPKFRSIVTAIVEEAGLSPDEIVYHDDEPLVLEVSKSGFGDAKNNTFERIDQFYAIKSPEKENPCL